MKKIMFSLVLALLMSLDISAQPVEEVEGTMESTSSTEEAGLVSFDFKDADVRNVLRIFSHKTGINIVASPDVQGSVTVKLNNVPWEKALKIILEMNDFAYVREENVIKVLTRDRIVQEPLKTEVIALDYAKADQIESTVQSMLSERGSVKIDQRANLLIITDVPSSFDPIKKVIKRLDLPTPQVLIETKLIETTLDLEKKFGIKWSFLDSYSVTYGGEGGGDFFKVNSESTNRSRSAGTSYSETYAPLLYGNHPRAVFTQSEDEDGNPVQELSGYEATRSELIDGKWKHPTWLSSTGGIGLNYSDGSSTAGFKAFGTSLTASKLSLVMSALMTDGGTDLLSSPSIVTMDNKEASIKVALDYPVPSFTYNEETSSYAITSFKEIPIGITLYVTPHVAPNGYVSMELKPTVSELQGSVYFANLGADLPLVNKEEVVTSIMVKDGDTVVLGGLMKQSDTYDNQKVPIFHSIPFLGWLFKSKEKTVEKRNLLIFVTPSILKKENVNTITQNKADEYTKMRESFDETTDLVPKLENW